MVKSVMVVKEAESDNKVKQNIKSDGTEPEVANISISNSS